MPIEDGRSLVILAEPSIEPKYSYTLPVTPQQIEFKEGNHVITHSILSVGDIAQLGGRKLNKIRFSSFFPEFDNSFYVNKKPSFIPLQQEYVDPFLFDPDVEGDLEIRPITGPTRSEFTIGSPQRWINIIKDLRDSEQVLRVMITYPEFEDEFVISNFMYSVVGGEGHDVRYTIDLVVYREVEIKSIRRYEFGQNYPTNKVSSRLFKLDNDSYIVRDDDTLISISRKTNVPVYRLRELNNIRDSSIDLLPGRIIYLTENVNLIGSGRIGGSVSDE